MRSAADKKISSPEEGGRSSDSDLLFRNNNNNIDDLPELLLVEILCRLPSNKLVFQCKCVCRRWFNLICGSYFVGRYLWLQRELQKPILSTLILVGIKRKQTISAVYDLPYLITTSDHPVFETLASNLTLAFLPCYHQDNESEPARAERFGMRLEPGSMVPPVVVGWYKDLLLCCATRCDQRHYYLCNPYTKQWVALPPTPGVYTEVYVSFFCDPYFNYSDDTHEEKRSCTSTSTRTSFFILNAEFTWRVVRLVPNASDPNFHVEMFSSETREWSELVVLCSHPFSSFCTFYYTLVSSVAYNGMAYWWCNDGLIFELDLSTSNSPIAKCRFIELPEGPGDIGIGILGVSGGRLRLCKHCEYLPESHEDGQGAFRVWELKQVVKDNQGKFKWSVDRVSITWTNIGEFHPHKILVLGFHPSNEDVVYFRKWDEYLACNFRGGMLEKVSHICSLEVRKKYRYNFMVPWWPTPVPNLKKI